MTTGVQNCRRCGAPIPVGALAGNCPRCLVTLVLSTSGPVAKAPKPSGPSKTTPPFQPLRIFGDYEILGEIARGGMGIVFRARQVSLNRTVALKMIAAGQLAAPAQVQRFRLEAEAAARLDHAHLVPIYEIGEHQGQHFYSMKFIPGGSLAGRLASGSAIAPREAARLGAILARAIDYAHQHGVLHRDLKPTNILLDEQAQPHITDFGLAKLFEDEASLTVSAAILGTPAYMAPEVAAGKAASATTGADIYSLGAVLYELLTGQPPFLADNVPALLRKIVEETPTRPEALRRQRARGGLLVPAGDADEIDRDLEVICLKCLEKESSRRYASAGLLAEDLERWLAGDTIQARPATAAETCWRWCRRQPVLAGLFLAIAALLIATAAGAMLALRRIDTARQAEQRAHHSAVQANRDLEGANGRLAASVSRLEFQLAEDWFQAGEAAGGLACLAHLARANPSNAIVTQRLFSALWSGSFPVPTTPALYSMGRVRELEFSPDGRQLLLLRENPFAGRNDSSVQLWDASSGQASGPPLKHPAAVTWARFSPTGGRILTLCADHAARLWDAATGRALGAPLAHDTAVRAACFSPDGKRALTVSEPAKVHLWETETGREQRSWTAHSSALAGAAFSPDGQRIVTASERGSVRLWQADSGAEATTQLGGTNLQFRSRVRSVQFRPDGRALLITCDDHTARLHEVATGRAVGEPLRHHETLFPARFSRDGRFVVTLPADREIQVCEAGNGRAFGPRLRHQDTVTEAEFSPDGRLLLTAAWNNAAHLWHVETGQPACAPLRQSERVMHVSFSPDGQHVATGCADSLVQVWDVRPSAVSEQIVRHAGPVRWAAFSADGSMFATASSDHTARVWDAATGQPITPSLSHASEVLRVEFSADRRRLVTAALDGRARVWSLPGGELLTVVAHKGPVSSARFDRASQRLLTASQDATARIVELPGGKTQAQLPHEGWVYEAAFSPDDAFVATASADHMARIWNARTGQPASPPLLHGDLVVDVKFSPQGDLLATASDDNTARVWDVRSGQSVGKPLTHTRTVCSVAFSPDGRRVATASWDRTARVWDARTGMALSEPMHHDDQVWGAEFSGDGARVVTAASDGSARVWDAVSGRPLTGPLRHGGRVVRAQFSPDGRRVLTASADGTARVWDVPTAPVPAPAWLADFAEAVGGLRVDAEQNLVFTGRNALQQFEAPPATAADFYAQFLRWFLSDRGSRPASPLALLPGESTRR
jgi:WD40 repeat protein